MQDLTMDNFDFFDLGGEKHTSAAFAILFYEPSIWVKGEVREFNFYVFLTRSMFLGQLITRLGNFELADVGNFMYNRSKSLFGQGSVKIDFRTDIDEISPEYELDLEKAVYRAIVEKYPNFGIFAAEHEVPIRMIRVNSFQRFSGDLRTLEMSRMVG